ncbi:hypothetical protein C942_03860 [Photobacterium marinum]|uniref:Uncharacterized protein n=1 Tax=Photobacterium marinum TaxID=1056511 RepID=L8J7A1_9GAMM|nr:hypothetical protein C942_03860 [Photobacterium marinum]
MGIVFLKISRQDNKLLLAVLEQVIVLPDNIHHTQGQVI